MTAAGSDDIPDCTCFHDIRPFSTIFLPAQGQGYKVFQIKDLSQKSVGFQSDVSISGKNLEKKD